MLDNYPPTQERIKLMADISAVFGILISLGIGFPGMLTALWLLFPATIERARLRLESTPWQCFWLGGVMTAVAVIPIVILLALPLGPAQFLGWTLITLVLAVSCIGFAGIASKMGAQLSRSNPGNSPAAAFVRGALALELAMGFPIFGWVFILPLAIVTALGATSFAVLHWMPKRAAVSVSEMPTTLQTAHS
jgi:hypothetical protein